jgi:acetoin utilization deacetylase AcuC-like enzyme
VHHGNGTAAIFAGDRRVFTLSIHEQDNYPAVKPPSSLDLGLPRGTGDAEYLAQLGPALARALEHLPDVLFYLAGADPFADDQLGGLRLTRGGLRRRDRLVLAAARDAGVPVVVLLAGGYARDVDDTVAIHVATVEEADRT